MSAQPVSRYLMEFAGIADSAHIQRPSKSEERTAALDQARKVEEAYARGVADGMAGARSEAEVRFTRQQQAHESALAAAREAWIQDIVETLQVGLARGLEQIEDRCAATTGQILVPFLSDRVRDQSLADMRDVLSRLLRESDAVSVTVSGPPDLVDAFRIGHDPGIELRVDPGTAADLSIVVNETRLETQMSAWVGRLQQAVAPASDAGAEGAAP